MTSERIKEIQEQTPYPKSISVMLALNQVWNECKQKELNVETGIKATIDGYRVWFKIDNQTFHLDEHIEETKKDSLKVAQFFEKMLKTAFKKLNVSVTEQLAISDK